MKIAVVSQYYPPEPVPIPEAVARGLAERGHEVRVVTGVPNYPVGRRYPGYGRSGSVDEVDGIQVLRVPIFVSHSRNALARTVNYVSFGLSSLRAWRFVRDCDAAYVYAPQMTAAMAPLAWSRRGLPFVLHLQDLWPESIAASGLLGRGPSAVAGRVLGPFLRAVYRAAGAIITVGPGLGALLTSRTGRGRDVHVVYNWAPDSARRAHAGTRRAFSSTRVVYAGNVGELQDLETAVRAAARVDDPGFLLEIVGVGTARDRLRALAASIAGDRVIFTPSVALNAMDEVYARSDFALVSLKPVAGAGVTIPSKLAASLARGVPVISTVPGDVADLVTTRRVGLTARAGQVAGLADAFRAAVKTPPIERRAMSSRSTELYREMMSKTAGIDSIEGVLAEVARSPHAKGASR
jgi:colanic acid biosynthesis glycosyl transferase WcaI